MYTIVDQLRQLDQEMMQHLHQELLPFWMIKTVNPYYGGFVGRIDGGNQIHYDAPKGVILNARILWSFSAAYRIFGNPEYLKMAERSFNELEERFWDPIEGGVYWMVNVDGSIKEAKKHSYAQAFALYGYSEYYRISNDESALHKAIALFNLLNQHAYIVEDQAYYEAFSRDWIPLEDVRLSEKDALEFRSTNTHLHILEAYTNLYRVWANPELANRLRALIDVFDQIIFEPETGYYHSFFDQEWKPKSTIYSFGHDIETIWLLSDAVALVGTPEQIDINRTRVVQVANTVYRTGLSDSGALYNQGSGGMITDSDHHWWAQVEAMVGFLHAYEITKEERFVVAAIRLWAFIKTYILDKENGEWFFRVNKEGVPYFEEDKVSEWKCPYHTSRACLEVHSRYLSILENSTKSDDPVLQVQKG
jgi:mannobiose 2-epimerase